MSGILTKQQIGKAGELLVQYRLLTRGIESAQLTTDSGIDLVAYIKGRAKTFQVKCNHKPKPSGGRGPLALDWWVPDDCPADYVALGDLSEERFWVFTMAQLRKAAQQQPKGRLHLYMYCEPPRGKRRVKMPSSTEDFDRFMLEKVFPL